MERCSFPVRLTGPSDFWPRNFWVTTSSTLAPQLSDDTERGHCLVCPGAGIATGAVTGIVLVFGELLPKTIAVHFPEQLAMNYVYPVRFFELLFYPIVTVLDRIGLGFRRLVSDVEGRKMLVSTGELRSAIDVGESEGVVAEDQAEMLHKVLEFTNTPVSKVMVPRTEIAWVVEGTSIADFLGIYADKPYSRFPVYRENTDNVVGIVSAKDVLMKLTSSCAPKDVLVDEVIRPAFFVPEVPASRQAADRDAR